MNWLPEHKCGLYLSHNEHRDFYKKIEEFYDPDEFISPEEWRKRTIMEMAREAGISSAVGKYIALDSDLERFAELVRKEAQAEEREEIAEFIEKTNLGSLPEATAIHYALLLKSYANAIRARGDKHD